MKATGIVRKVDGLGRIVIPRELMRVYKIDLGDSIEIYTNDGGEIVLKKYIPSCIICGGRSEEYFKEKKVCNKCKKELSKLL